MTSFDAVDRIEWLETPDPPKPEKVKEAKPVIRVSRILECPRCGWQEAERADACFRCGEPFSKDLIEGAQIQELRCLEAVNLEQYDYQIETCHTVLSQMKGTALLADEVGLGKTIEAGLVLKELVLRELAERVLVLTPASLTYQWREELESKFGESFTIVDQPKQWEDLQDNAQAKVIISLDRAKGPRHSPPILAKPWDILIVDEGHRLKNRNTQAHQFVSEIERRFMLMLTATPVHNDLTELYTIINLLKPGQLGTLKIFREQFIKSGDPRSPENAGALQQLLSEVMIRNRRGEVDVHFPRRNAAVIHLSLQENERQLYDQLTSFIREMLRAPTAGKAKHLRLGLMTLQRELCSSPAAVAHTLAKIAEDPAYGEALRAKISGFKEQAEEIGYPTKVDVVLDLIEKYPDKFLIFTEFRQTQKELLRALEESGIKATAFHGQLNAKEKEKAVRAFRDEVQVLVSTESGGEGRNLQFCHQLINFDLPWNPMRVEQRIGRVHRLGQKHEVSIFNLCTSDTLEAYLLDLLVKKIRMFELVVGELDLIIGDNERPSESKSFEELFTQAWLSSEDEIDLQISLDTLGESFEDARKRYLDRRVLNEDLFNALDDAF